jgi:fatty-acyl-CoA synthase
MKYAFMSFSCPELSLDETLALVGRYSYDGLEPRISANHGHGIDTTSSKASRAEARRKAEDAGVPLCCIATSCRYADPDDVAAQVSDTRACIELAHDVGSPRLRVFGGQLGEGLEREAAIEQVGAALASVAEDAAAAGVTICVETHDAWTDPDHVAAVMTRADHPAIAVNWDIMHPVRQSGWTIADSYTRLKPWIRHVHFHDGLVGEKLVMTPIGEGNIDHNASVQVLAADGYSGYLSGEWINWEPWADHLPRELATMRAYEAAL